MKGNFSRALLVGGAAAMFIARPASATTLLKMELDDLTRTSDAVVRGKVTKLESHWTGDRMRIVTEVQIEVSEAMKGTVGKTVTVQQPGGVVGDIGQRVEGLASFSEGEEVVLFLESLPGSTFLVAGMAQGKYRLERSSDGTATYAIPEQKVEALLLDPITRKPAAPELARPLELEVLRTRVRTVLKASLPPVSPAPQPLTPRKVGP